MELVIITACRNSLENFIPLCQSIDCQEDDRWRHIVVDDLSDAGKGLDGLAHESSDRREVRSNVERKWALRNIIEVARGYQDRDDVVIATVDGDDELCNTNAVGLVLEAYEDPDVDVVWTAQRWDIRDDVNVSREMPQGIDPYEFPWCASHLRTFRASLLRYVSDENFQDHHGEWFHRGYDQALMLPILKVGGKRRYIDEVCYLYKMDSVSIPLSDRPGSEVEQISNIAFLRARGFVG